MLNKKVDLIDINQWNLEDIRIILTQSICYLVGINLRDVAVLHSGYYTFDSFKV